MQVLKTVQVYPIPILDTQNSTIQDIVRSNAKTGDMKAVNIKPWIAYTNSCTSCGQYVLLLSMFTYIKGYTTTDSLTANIHVMEGHTVD